MKETATFIVSQTLTNIRHPFDLDSYDNSLQMAKSENARFYEIKNFQSTNFTIIMKLLLLEPIKEKSHTGRIEKEKDNYWVTKKAILKNVFVIIKEELHIKVKMEH